jgi:hypothetical protein
MIAKHGAWNWALTAKRSEGGRRPCTGVFRRPKTAGNPPAGAGNLTKAAAAEAFNNFFIALLTGLFS